VNGAIGICFRVARWCAGKQENHASHWSIQCRGRFPAGWIVAIRLAERNAGLLDYLLLPTTEIAGPLIRFSEKARAPRGIERFEKFDPLVRSLIRRVTRESRSSATKSIRSKRPRTAILSRSRKGRAPH
jgi:hypothetical protein